ncbi:MAG: hypothetical protein IJC80_07125 [Clostridia bacterium]|nr:hypothetical protein [Clostridia bacterium]
MKKEKTKKQDNIDKIIGGVSLNLKYPIVLVHGMGFRDRKKYQVYWGRVPKMYRKMGAEVYFGGQDSTGAPETNARQVGDAIDKVLSKTGAEKVNVISHSKGGLDTRYLISTLGYGDKIASLTMLQTPHHGSKTVDWLMKFPRPLVRLAGFLTSAWYKILGDKKPAAYKCFELFTTQGAEKFNKENPDVDGIYYQSYAFVMKHFTSDFFMWLTSLVVGWGEGENDGLLPPSSVMWGDFKGIVRSNSARGISHADEVDFRRRRFTKKSGDGVCDILEIYKKIVVDLEERGF